VEDHDLPPLAGVEAGGHVTQGKGFLMGDDRMMMTVDANEDGIITGVRGDVEAMTGWTEPDLVGQDIDVLMPRKFRERHHSSLDTYVATGKKKAMGSWVEVEALHRDGSTIPIMLVVTERAGVLQGIIEEMP
jgi:PAS domain S-box-containing protein